MTIEIVATSTYTHCEFLYLRLRRTLSIKNWSLHRKAEIDRRFRSMDGRILEWPLRKIYIYLFLSGWISVTRLDDFWKLLRGKLSHKSSPNEWRLFGLFWKASLQTIHCFGSFLDNFKVVFISPSGHTDLYVSAQSGKCFSRSLKQCDQIWPNPLGFTEC